MRFPELRGPGMIPGLSIDEETGIFISELLSKDAGDFLSFDERKRLLILRDRWGSKESLCAEDQAWVYAKHLQLYPEERAP